MKQAGALCAVVVALMQGPVLAAPSVEEMARIFGAREAVQQASLSPSGTKLVMVQADAGPGSIVTVTDLSAAGQLVPKVILKASGMPERISRCDWAGDSRLVCNIYGITLLQNTEITYSSRLVSMNPDGTSLKVLQNRSGGRDTVAEANYGGSVIDWSATGAGHILIQRDYIPEETVGTLVAQKKDGLGVDDLDVASLRSRTVEQPRDEATEYITDGKGNVRVMGTRGTAAQGYSSGKINYFFRNSGHREWLPMSVYDSESREGFNPYHVDPVRNVAYGLKEVGGRLAAFSRSLEPGGAEVQLFAHQKVDVDGFETIGVSQRVIGITYATDRREIHYLDPALEKLARSLGKSLPNSPKINFVDSSSDETRLLIWAGGDTDPGRYYLLDRKAGKLEELVGERPAMTFPMSTVRSISYPAADGTMVPGYLTMPPGRENAKDLRAIVLPHGGPGARDEWGFDWLSQFFANQGYAVLQPNFRGSEGYGDEWFQKNGFQNWRTAIGDVNDAGRWLVQQGIAQPGGLAVLGWSYGGYAALQSGVIEPDLFKAIIAIAPVSDLEKWREQWRNWTNYQVMNRLVGNGPHIAAGSPARHADQIKAPVLIFHGTLDRNVNVAQGRLMNDRLRDSGKDAQLVIYEGLDHYLEDGTVRADMLSKSAAFLTKALGGAQ